MRRSSDSPSFVELVRHVDWSSERSPARKDISVACQNFVSGLWRRAKAAVDVAQVARHLTAERR